MARRRRTTTRRGLVDMNMLRDAGVAATGYMAAEVALAKLPLPAAFLASPTSRALTTIGVGILAGVALRRVAGPRLGTALATGMVANGIVQFGRGFLPGVGSLGYMPASSYTPSVAGQLMGMTDDEFERVTSDMLGLGASPFQADVSRLIDADTRAF